MENQSEELSLRDLIIKAKEWFYYLLSKWKIIALFVLIGASIGVGYSLYKKPVYTAVLTFALEDEKSGGGLSSALAGQFGLDLGGGGGGMFTGGNLIELFKSRHMVEKTLLSPTSKNSTLIESFIFNNEMRDSWKNNDKLKNIKFLPNPKRVGLTRIQDSILGQISNAIIKTELTVVQ